MGADMAATFGGPASDAVSALSSVLKGEFDPIERYGVSLKQSDINARLAAQGQANLTGEALKQAQAQAALDLVTQQTSATQGMFASESDTAAGAQAAPRRQVRGHQGGAGGEAAADLHRRRQLDPGKGDPGVREVDREGRPAARRVRQGRRVHPRPADAHRQGPVAWWQDHLIPVLDEVARFITDTVVPAFEKIWDFVKTYVVPILRDTLGPALDG
jgi:hypothetical protein